MRTDRYLSLLLLPGLSGLAFCATSPVWASSRATFNLNPGWRLFAGDPTNATLPNFDDATWKALALSRARNEDRAFKASIDELPTGIAWYRKHFGCCRMRRGKRSSSNSKASAKPENSTSTVNGSGAAKMASWPLVSTSRRKQSGNLPDAATPGASGTLEIIEAEIYEQ